MDRPVSQTAPTFPPCATPAGVEREHRHLHELLFISRAIGTVTNVDELIPKILDHAASALKAERASLYLHDPVQCQLWTRVAHGLENAGRPLRIPQNHGLAGHVFTSGQTLLIHDTLQSPHFDAQRAQAMGYLPRSMVVVPVMHHPPRCDGVLQIMDSRVGRFTDDDAQLASAIATVVSISLENARLIHSQRQQFESFVRALSAALDARDPSTQEHSANVANLAMGIGHALGLPKNELEYLRIAGLVHDVGKIGTPEAILTKPGKLTDDEFAVMRQHAAHSRTILQQITFTDEFKDLPHIAPAHHEKLDGTGYPDGLVAEQMSLKARILCVADMAHALMQDRHYRPGMTREQAFAILDKLTPHQLDADCVAALKTFLGSA